MLKTITDILTDNNFIGAILSSIIFIAIGFFFRKKEIINKNGKKAISALVLKLAVPAMAFNAFMTTFNKNDLLNNLYVLILSFVLYFLFILLGHLIFRGLDNEKKKLCAIFISIGQLTFFSIPLLQAIYEDKSAIIPATIMTIPFRVMIYIYAFSVISSKSENNKSKLELLKNVFLNPIMISMFLGIFIWITQDIMPQTLINNESYSILRIDKTLPFLYRFISMANSLSTPLCMMLIGLTLGEANIKDALSSKLSWLVTTFRCILIPIFVALVVYLINLSGIIMFNEYQAAALVIGFSAPVSAVINSYCLEYDNNPYLSSNVCFTSTLVSIITLPMMFIVVKLLFA